MAADASTSRRRLLEALNGIHLVDHHAHGILGSVPELEEFRGLFSESPDPRQWPHAATSLTYRRAIRVLAEHLGCEPTEQAVVAHRRESDPEEYAAALLRPTATDWLLVDDGYPPPGQGYGWQKLGELAGSRTRPVMRLERVAEEALAREGSLGDLLEHVRSEVASARGRGFAGLKTVAAYRTGLDVAPRDVGAAERALRARPSRLESKPLLELVLDEALEANAATGPLPVQVHCGFGDPDLLLAKADPTYFKPVVERFPTTTFVLLHCYPFIREAGWMAYVYANVFLDVSVTIPLVARPAEWVRQALELAPVTKFLYASDASRTPELYFLAARWWREALAEVLGEALSAAEAEEAGRRILRENALELYALA